MRKEAVTEEAKQKNTKIVNVVLNTWSLLFASLGTMDGNLSKTAMTADSYLSEGRTKRTCVAIKDCHQSKLYNIVVGIIIRDQENEKNI